MLMISYFCFIDKSIMELTYIEPSTPRNRNSDMRVFIEIPAVMETIDFDLDRYHNSNNNIIYESTNGYRYFAIDGLTVTFFRPIADNINYHIVVGMLSQEQLNDMNILYDDLLRLNPIFTFRFNNQEQSIIHYSSTTSNDTTDDDDY